MSRVSLANQCRVQKPQAPTDTRLVHCLRTLGHLGPHTAGRYYTWDKAYTEPASGRQKRPGARP